MPNSHTIKRHTGIVLDLLVLVLYNSAMPHPTDTIAIFTGPEGHLSIAEAIQEDLAQFTDRPVVQFFERNVLFTLYMPFYRYFPQAFKAPYELSKHKQAQRVVREMSRQQYNSKIGEFLEENRPKTVISTYYLFNPSLEFYQKKYGFRFINILTDPRSLHPVMLSSGADVNMVFDESALQLAQEFSPEAKIEVGGWFVRKRFQPLPSAEAHRKLLKELGFQPDLPLFLIASGSEGSNLVMKILPMLFTNPIPVQVVVACGSNQTLLRSVKALAKILDKTNRGSVLRALPFTPDIHLYMQAADLVIGKAGPNTIFESVATGTPFMAISHISGQESGNLEIIRDYKIGYVEENPLKATRLLQEFLAHPRQLEAWHPHLHTLATQLGKSKDILKKYVK